MSSPSIHQTRIRAPQLSGRGGWINTGGRQLSLTDLRGRFVLLDFWTFCCINCLHVLDELRPLEQKYADILVIVGVHSPKFVHEADHDALVAAVDRYDVRHPVLDDPDLATWQAYTARAWPTLTLIDPEGYIVGQYSGEGHGHALDAILGELVAGHEARGTLRRGDSPYVAPEPEPTELRFPGKLAALPDGNWLVSDTGHHSLAVLDPAAERVIHRIGSGDRGLVDGAAEVARFSEPHGLCLLPAEVAAAVGYDVVVADTVNHALRAVDLSSGQVRTVGGSGRQWMQGDGTAAMSSPMDVAWWRDRVWIAMAGVHQLWTFDPLTGAVEVAAGTTNEGLVDGPLSTAWFAQTSGLAPADDLLWLVDAETSALRSVRPGETGLEMGTAVGTGLFDFGMRDGPAGQALMQHPVGLTTLPDGSVAICDTYNDAVRRYDPVTGQVSTLANGLREPSDAAVDGQYLLVVESAAHRLTRVPLGAAAVRVADFAQRTQRPPTKVAPGALEIVVVFDPPPGQKLDDRYGPATRLLVSATPAGLLRNGAGREPALSRTIEVDPAVGEGVLHVAAMAASCDGDAENAACHMHQQDWGIPVIIAPDGARCLELLLGGAPTAEG